MCIFRRPKKPAPINQLVEAPFGTRADNKQRCTVGTQYGPQNKAFMPIFMGSVLLSKVLHVKQTLSVFYFFPSTFSPLLFCIEGIQVSFT